MGVSLEEFDKPDTDNKLNPLSTSAPCQGSLQTWNRVTFCDPATQWPPFTGCYGRSSFPSCLQAETKAHAERTGILRDDMDLQRDYNIAIQNSFSALEDLPEDVESAWNPNPKP